MINTHMTRQQLRTGRRAHGAPARTQRVNWPRGKALCSQHNDNTPQLDKTAVHRTCHSALQLARYF